MQRRADRGGDSPCGRARRIGHPKGKELLSPCCRNTLLLRAAHDVGLRARSRAISDYCQGRAGRSRRQMHSHKLKRFCAADDFRSEKKYFSAQRGACRTGSARYSGGSAPQRTGLYTGERARVSRPYRHGGSPARGGLRGCAHLPPRGHNARDDHRRPRADRLRDCKKTRHTHLDFLVPDRRADRRHGRDATERGRALVPRLCARHAGA